MMRDREQPEHQLRQPAIAALLRQHGVDFAYLFGSRARGQETTSSDVDLAIRLPESMRPGARLDEATALGSSLEKLLGLRVDVLVLNDASPLLRHEAVIRGATILSPGLEQLMRYEKLIRMQFEDFCHIQAIFAQEHRRRLGLES